MEHKQELDTIKLWFMTGAIDYDKAKELSSPHIKAINIRFAEIAKKHGVKPKTINFASFMR